MSQLAVTSSTGQHHAAAWRARLWSVLVAFGAASAVIDPSGLASAQRWRALRSTWPR